MSDIGARVTRSIDYTYAGTGWIAVPLDVEIYDNNNIHDVAVNNERLTCKTPGRYFAHGAVQWDAPGAAERRGLYIKQTTPSVVQLGLTDTNCVPAANQPTAYSGGGIFELGIDDYLELYAYATIGSEITQVDDSSPIFGMQYLNAEEGCRVRNNTNFNVSSGVEAFPSFNDEDWDSASMWSAGAPSRITVPSLGWYLFCTTISIGDLHSGYRRLSIRKNGLEYIARVTMDPSTSGTTGMNLVAIDYSNAGDYFEVGIYHDQGAVQEIKGSDAGWSGFSLGCNKLTYEDLAEFLQDSDLETLIDSGSQVLTDSGL